MKNKLEICKQTRRLASETLYKILRPLLQSSASVSEQELRDLWLNEVHSNSDIFSDGWYVPPPHGIAILFADDKDVARVNFKSLRPKEIWPRDDIFLNWQNGIAYLYACPVDKSTGIIGDFQITLYFGNNPEIKDLLKTCYSLDKEIFQFAQIGMRFSEVAVFAEKLMKKNGMLNEVFSITDKAVENIGHTIPVSYEDWNENEKAILLKGEEEWEDARDIISNKRIFLNSQEEFIIKPGMAFTIEPRPKIIDKPHLPTSLAYHTIVLFKEDGSKELLTDFDDIFSLTGMDYMLN